MQGRRLGYTTHALLSINLMDAPERLELHEKIARACIEVTARLGARNMVLHCGMAEDTSPDALEAAYSRQRECLARLGDFAAQHGVLICVETIWNFDGRETALPGRLAAEIRAVGHDVDSHQDGPFVGVCRRPGPLAPVTSPGAAGHQRGALSLRLELDASNSRHTPQYAQAIPHPGRDS